MDKLNELLKRCKCGVYLTVNAHRDYYRTAAQTLDELSKQEDPPEIPDDVRQKMIESNTIIDLQFYPNTPVSFYVIYHHDLNAALDEALAILNDPES